MRTDGEAARRLPAVGPPAAPATESSDTTEFERMYRASYPWLVGYCRRILRGRGDPEAVAQEALIRAWSTPDRYHGSRFDGWLRTIALRLSVGVLRHADVEQRHAGTIADPPADVVSIEELVMMHDEHRLAGDAFRRMPSDYRRIMWLHYVNGWSYADIAHADQMSLEAVRGRLRRARTSFRSAYAKLASARGLVAFPWCRALRDRILGRSGHLNQTLAPWILALRPGEIIVGLVAIATVMTGVPTAAVSGDHSLLAPTSTGTQEPPTADIEASRAKTPTRGVTRAMPDRPPTRTDAALDVVPPPGNEKGEPSFVEFTPSPNYQTDGTVFGIGRRRDCLLPCNGLFRTTDRGVTWERLPALGFTGGTIHLPPSYPRDPRIFLLAGAGPLMVSNDGGKSFLPVIGPPAETGTHAAISPDFDNDGWIVLGDSPWEYRDRVGAVVPATLVTSFAPTFSPAFRTDRTMFMGTNGAALTGRITRCIAQTCTESARFPGDRGALKVVVSPRYSGGGVVAAFTYRSLYVSPNGIDFAPVATPLPIRGSVTSVVIDRRDRLLVATAELGALPVRGGLAVSDDGGRSWRALGEETRLATGVVEVKALSDGRILAALHHVSGGGLVCSVDDGTTWHPVCPS
jgi:RNA polymerase sigma factor (sigma-70 family)